MADRCPRCRVAPEDPRALVCPQCGYSLRLPAVGKAGGVLLGVGLLAFLLALFTPEEIWVDILLGGIIALVAGLGALFASGWLIGRARRA
ncbi:MAG: hypothetical protein ACE5LS_03435 [Thermoplasmata archaeon]